MSKGNTWCKAKIAKLKKQAFNSTERYGRPTDDMAAHVTFRAFASVDVKAQAPRAKSGTRGKAEVGYMMRDGFHASLYAAEGQVTLIRNGRAV